MEAAAKARKPLSELEHVVMSHVWSGGAVTAETVRELLSPRRLKESTVRTLLRRLEQKGYVSHTVEGRTYVYRGVEKPQAVAARLVRQIIDRLCGGSVEQFLVGMVDHGLFEAQDLRDLRRTVARRDRRAKGNGAPL